MNGQKLIAAEFVVSVSILGWGAAKEGFWPWPASVARAAFGFAVLSLVGLFNDRLAALLGAGFLLAQILKAPVDGNGNFRFTGGVPQGLAYGLLAIPGSGKKSTAERPDQTWTPGSGSSNKGAALPAAQNKGNGGIVSA